MNYVRNIIIMQRLETPQKVTLPKGRTFYVKYNSVGKSYLPPNIKKQRKFEKEKARRR